MYGDGEVEKEKQGTDDRALDQEKNHHFFFLFSNIS